MRILRFEPGTHGFQIQQDIHHANEANAKYRYMLKL